VVPMKSGRKSRRRGISHLLRKGGTGTNATIQMPARHHIDRGGEGGERETGTSRGTWGRSETIASSGRTRCPAENARGSVAEAVGKGGASGQVLCALDTGLWGEGVRGRTRGAVW
jgi:hypothetical protein